MREQPGITEKSLQGCLREQYGLSAVTLEFLPLGLDYNAGVYRVVDEEGKAHLLKAKSGAFYEAGCLLPYYLKEQGVMAVVAPIPTRNGALWGQIEGWTVIVYPFIEGDTSWEGMTDELWRETGRIFKQIHQVRLPPAPGPLRLIPATAGGGGPTRPTIPFSAGAEGHRKGGDQVEMGNPDATSEPVEMGNPAATGELADSGNHADVRRESFDVSGYARWVREFEREQVEGQEGGKEYEQALRAIWREHQATIHMMVEMLEKLAGVLQRGAGPSVICHADLHARNLIRSSEGQVFVIDWDDVMLAPKERDFLFVGDPAEDGSGSPFFQGYGETVVDWVALTYYRYERVVQDLIECARRAFFRDDLGDESRAGAVELFQMVLAADGRMVEAAGRARAHLPADLKL